jgi:hypothetical protein
MAASSDYFELRQNVMAARAVLTYAKPGTLPRISGVFFFGAPAKLGHMLGPQAQPARHPPPCARKRGAKGSALDGQGLPDPQTRFSEPTIRASGTMTISMCSLMASLLGGS